MNIIAEAKAAPRVINSKSELLQKQLEMLKTMCDHHAISEAEYRRSSGALISQMQSGKSF